MISQNKILLLSAAILLLAACGQTGPLYLPGNPSEIRTDVPKQETQTEKKTDDDSDDAEDDKVEPDNPPE